MNRYQQEVAELDARHQLRVRTISFLGAVTFIVVALWAADFRVGSMDLSLTWQGVKEWWQQDWFPEKDERHAIAPQLPMPVTVDGSKSNEPTTVLPGTDSSISPVPLPLILVRTEPGRNANEGLAYMGTARENPQTYAAGAVLANGVRIKEIHSDYVLLERDNKSVKLYVEGKKQSAKALNDMLTVGGQPEVRRVVATHHEILTDYIRPSPVYDGTMIKGYQVYPGQRSGVFSQMGLQSGDVVLSLNDTPFVDPQQSIDLFKQLTQGIAMIASVERKGKVERVSLDGALITADQERNKVSQSAPAAPIGPDM